LVDEAHHNPAESWQQVKRVYSYSVVEAIAAGYVKCLRAKMLRPTELRYVDRSGGQEKVIGPDEVRELGETDAEFRRGIVMSDETLGSIVDHAITELRRLRTETGEQRLKIIASAVNIDHCIQITGSFSVAWPARCLRPVARGRRCEWTGIRSVGTP
jgi:hypothetical protein